MQIYKSKQYLTCRSAAEVQRRKLKQKHWHYYFVKLSAFENSPCDFLKSNFLTIADLHYAERMEKRRNKNVQFHEPINFVLIMKHDVLQSL
jgi:hypothetical protein